jgi:predicted transcriptional regulator of viral defense system
MDFARVVALTSNLHCFSPGMVSAGEPLDQVRVQISRWVQSGRVIRVHKGWYTLSEPFRHVRVDTNVIASVIRHGSYVSLQSALAFHGMIPEHVAMTTAVTTGRPITVDSPFGRIRYHHVKTEAFFGYARHEAGLQHAHIATPEKALLDLFYLTPGSDNVDYVLGLRLQALDGLDVDVMRKMSARFDQPKIGRAVEIVAALRESAGGGQ